MAKNNCSTSSARLATERKNAPQFTYCSTNKFMKALLWMAMTICLSSNLCFSQVNFSDETKKYIDYNDPVTVFKNALLIDGKGNPAKPHQTVIIRNGKIDWIGDDAKALVPRDGKIIDLNGKALMPGLVMLHEHLYISAFNGSFLPQCSTIAL